MKRKYVPQHNGLADSHERPPNHCGGTLRDKGPFGGAFESDPTKQAAGVTEMV